MAMHGGCEIKPKQSPWPNDFSSHICDGRTMLIRDVLMRKRGSSQSPGWQFLDDREIEFLHFCLLSKFLDSSESTDWYAKFEVGRANQVVWFVDFLKG